MRERLQADIRRHKTLVCNIAGQLFPELRHVFKDLSGQTALALLRSHAAAAVIRELPVAVFISEVRAVFHGQHLMVSKLRRAYTLAHTSVGLQASACALQRALDQHIATRAHLQRQREQAEEALTDVFLALPEAD